MSSSATVGIEAQGAHSGIGRGRNGVPDAGRAQVEEIQRARLLSAMVAVASERGLVDATVARVVARAGVSRRTFYELFEDREACFLAALDEAIARVSRDVLAAYDPGAKWLERLRTGLTALLAFFDAEPGAARLLIVGSLGAGPRALERRKRTLAPVTAVVAEGAEAGRGAKELPPLMVEGLVGGAISVVHARLLERDERLMELAKPLVSMIVLPYLGPAAARRELERAAPRRAVTVEREPDDPLRGLDMRLTYRTVRVLTCVAELSGASNRQIGQAAGIPDQGQTSKLLTRLRRIGLIDNAGGVAPAKGAPNAWTLTPKGFEVARIMGIRALETGGEPVV